ncbi:S1/P1 nuclease, partial [Xanthovirga aplysinae]|uniref:S1/P1 nuclease n=1 Tax=Xanthovirga aplysinae TaxID=2529853 RepID=UPI0012BC9B8F
EQHLSKKAKKNISKIMGHESLAIASTWADFIKSDPNYDYSHEWHYANIPNGEKYDPKKGAEHNVVKEIIALKKQLENPATTLEEKKIALRFLVHLVGDIHQPMHVGQPEDLGGNRIEMKWFGKKTNLHRIWDSQIIDSQKLSYTELGNSINNATKVEIKQWQSSTVEQWANESKEICDGLYETSDDEISTYKYMYRYYPVVQSRLLMGGIRLAGLLNEIFG